MKKKRETPFSAGNQTRAPWAGLTFLVGLVALFVTLYAGQNPQVSTIASRQVATDRPTELPDFAAIPIVYEKKKAFFAFMTPLIKAENNAILAHREHLLQLHEAERISQEKLNWMTDLASHYRLTPFSPDSPEDRRALLARVDIIPLSLAMAQAANESAWGTSRFAREGNNIFGQWVFGKGKGMVPKNRTEGASHEVARFDTVSDSIAGYIYNLNTLWAYEPLRALRYEQRSRGVQPNGEVLAMGLERYSSRGKAYIMEIQQLIRFNDPLLSKR